MADPVEAEAVAVAVERAAAVADLAEVQAAVDPAAVVVADPVGAVAADLAANLAEAANLGENRAANLAQNPLARKRLLKKDPKRK